MAWLWLGLRAPPPWCGAPPPVGAVSGIHHPERRTLFTFSGIPKTWQDESLRKIGICWHSGFEEALSGVVSFQSELTKCWPIESLGLPERPSKRTTYGLV